MPVGRSQDDRRSQLTPLDHLDRLDHHPLLYTLALSIEVIEFVGNITGDGRVVGPQQLEADIGRFEPSGRV